MQLDEPTNRTCNTGQDDTYVSGWRLFCWLPVCQALRTSRFPTDGSGERCTHLDSDNTCIPTINIILNKALHLRPTLLRTAVTFRSIRGLGSSAERRIPEVASSTSQHGLELYVHFALLPQGARGAMSIR